MLVLGKHKKNLKVFIVFLGLLGLFSHAQSHAGEPIQLVTGSNYAPFSDENLPKGGLATAIVLEAFKEMGITSAISWKPWKRGFVEAQKGRYVGTFPYIPTTEREVDFLYSNPIFTQSYIALSRIDESVEYSFYEDMSGKTLCRPVGYAIADKIQNMIGVLDITLFQPTNMTSCIKAVTRLKNHVVVLNRLQAEAELKKLDQTVHQIKVHYLKEKGFTLHFIVSKTLPNAQDWIDKFNFGLQKIKKTGAFEKMSREFGIEPVPVASK